MNRRLAFGILAFAMILSALPAAAAGSEAVQVDVISDAGDRIVLEYRLLDYRSETLPIDGENYEKLLVPGEPVFKTKGSPELPLISRSIIIPDDAAMSVQVLSVSYHEKLARIAPSKGFLSRTADPKAVPFEFGEAYKVDSFFPGPVATLGDPYILRDHRGVTVRFSPFQYNPVTGVLRVYTAATIEIAAAGPGLTNVLVRGDRPRARVRAFEDLYTAQFLNAVTGSGGGGDNELFYDPLDETGDMLVICHDAWIDNMTPFVNHKAGKGITATVVGVGTIGNDPTSIKSYIQDVYDTSDLAFVLLVGDAAQVATPQASGGASDPSYSKLAGADNYPDIIVGRFSAGTAAEVDTQVTRTIEYEDLPAMTQDWFWRGTGIASAEGAGIGDEGQSDIQHQDEIRDWLLGAGYTEVDQIYDPGATDTQVANAVNAGRGVMNYTGHGSSTSWGTTGFNVADVDALVNDNMLPFIFSVACVNGNFDNYGKCFAEAWLRATNNGNGEPTGAVAMYASSINQSWAPPMEAQDEFNLLLTNPTQPYAYFGTMCYAASCSMMDAYGSGGVDMFNTWILFGDPSVHIVGETPQSSGLRVTPADGLHGTSDAGGPVSPDTIVYTLKNLEDVAMDYEVVTHEPWVTATDPTGTLPPGGTVQVTVYFNEHSRNCDNGAYSDSIQFLNNLNHEGDTTRTASFNVGSVTTMHSWSLDADPGWTMEGEWQYGVPAGAGGEKTTGPDPTAGATGTNVIGANLAGNISKLDYGTYFVTLGPLDFTGVSGLSLSYQRWLNTIGMPDVSSWVEISGGGMSYESLWSADAVTADNVWIPQTFDISGAADGQNDVYIRWGYQVVNKVPKTSSGWNLDDIYIEGIAGSARIRLTVEPDSLSWTSTAGAGGYDVVRGDIGTLLESGGDFTLATEACLGDDLSGTSLAFTDVPADGEGFWFLVRGITGSGPMTYQTLEGVQVGVRDEEIDAAAGSCP